ncbi:MULTISPECIES: phosphogluconate dehydratase [Pseudomonas]|jgi:phosphogluconate dehydratase|uniref:Phosphogluconate dehydratase n=29 Tax=Gammaproteobacteria TaxID=1236 RepID=EDD_PSEAE|nr:MULTISPECIES: phosphogluconate dehydratase [Pseudomonas]NP_251884.1 phosphogluconate dehydratase [Pseudomonas aeruginosa PAO1]P31961.3 RecName: Full=Phosphogluconate dehydratase; AltName: Full=6-phosphogluconate dehydratase [Pseudomonas aeruginosa PAO1]AID85784.1 phosphogluconate dehydratase [Pseudomonas aeruginosa VRFPA04]EAZ53597.1 phosphogluconate dehydratase [Pseudomonas aeruginosa C3719]EAZ59322.1 phosphogluconate dehydratase [Pseudomonas aeruginosa 2192]EQL39738.1 phosphogluconate de
MHPRVLEVTRRIQARSAATRQRYLEMVRAAASKGPHRGTLPCGNLAHGVAACGESDKQTLRLMNQANVAIVSAYNDMLSAHQPFERFPGLIKQALHEIGSVGQFAGGVPAMCDGVTQGEPGMELSLASRDVIAMSTAIALSHNMFDAALCLGVCDKIVPGLLIGSLRFGHLPTVFVPAGPMPTGISNKEKAAVRQLFAEGKATREELLASEMASYHAPGTCTFYGTANTNQLLVEVMGLHLPGASFVNPNTPLRDELTREAARQASRLTPENGNYVPMAEIVDEKAIVNSVVALLATGGSTNHTLHLLAIAQAAGIQLTWQDMSELSHVVPTLARIYPNGQADINHFQAAGGMSFLIRQLLDGGLLHEDVQTVAGPGLRRYTREPFLEDGRLVWREGPERSLDEAILRPLDKPFSAEGGLRLMEGNLGRGVMKVSAVAPEHQVVEAPVRIFHDQASLAAAFKAGELERDLVAVVRFQGPRANGMPELHKLTPFLGVLQDRGFKVALVTDGRMSGASGKVPAAIHVSPEAIAGGPLARLRDGDRVRVDGVNGELRVLVDDAEWQARSLEPAPQDGNLGCGRELFAFMRNAMSSAEEGACSFTESLNGWR